jgi:hypothetical protein
VNFDGSERFPLGEPTNREKPSELTPIHGRPNWLLDRKGREVYVEPPRPDNPAGGLPSTYL